MAVNIFYTIRDGDNDKSTINIPVDNIDIIGGVDLPFILEAGWDILNPLLNGQLVSCGMTAEIEIDEFTNAAAAAISDVQEKAEFVFGAVGGFLKRISLPTFIETFFTNSGAGKEVDITQTAVANFITMMEDGIPDALVVVTPVQPVTDHGEDVEAYLESHQVFGKNRY